MNIKLTLFFDGAFWTGLFEHSDSKNYTVARVIFHTEPSNQEVLEYIFHQYNELDFSAPISSSEAFCIRKINPKRLQRLVRKETDNVGIGTKAQQALKLDQEDRKLQRKSLANLKKHEIADTNFQLHQRKKKKSKKGTNEISREYLRIKKIFSAYLLPLVILDLSQRQRC